MYANAFQAIAQNCPHRKRVINHKAFLCENPERQSMEEMDISPQFCNMYSCPEVIDAQIDEEMSNETF
jgi:hypothetical protein